MSEEQSNFKVTDRRLFNPDGSPRDVERDAESSPTSAAAPSSPATQETAPAPSASAAAASAVTTTTADSAQKRETVASDIVATSQPSPIKMPNVLSDAPPQQELTPADEDYAAENMIGADDPASFVNFLMSIASNAAASLGMMEHPVTGQLGVDLPLGKHWIDVLGMLKQKTQGNLTAQEREIFEGLLADLRMQFVSLTSAAPPSAPRGFTGRDITGGK